MAEPFDRDLLHQLADGTLAHPAGMTPNDQATLARLALRALAELEAVDQAAGRLEALTAAVRARMDQVEQQAAEMETKTAELLAATARFDAIQTDLAALRADNDRLRELVDLAARAADALSSTVIRPADLPSWWWEVFRELHRVGSNHEPPDPDTTARLERQVDAAYDHQADDPDWWKPDRS